MPLLQQCPVPASLLLLRLIRTCTLVHQAAACPPLGTTSTSQPANTAGCTAAVALHLVRAALLHMLTLTDCLSTPGHHGCLNKLIRVETSCVIGSAEVLKLQAGSMTQKNAVSTVSTPQVTETAAVFALAAAANPHACM